MFEFLENRYLGFKDKETNHQFKLWQYKYSVKQIQYISSLTAIVYILGGISNIYLLPDYLINTLLPHQLIVMPIYLFLISYLTYRQTHIELTQSLLLFSPIFAMLNHAYIFSQMDTYSTYQVEIYLMIFWIFTISGLKFIKSLFAASIVFLIGMIYPYIAYDNQDIGYFSHATWMIVSMIFGIGGGFLFHQSKKDTFEKELELNKLATTDKLTGLYNRTKLDSILILELDRAKRYEQNIGFLLIDVDFFKDVNDTYGHLVGDEVLISISKNIKNNIRSSDSMFRWGGEEFIIICIDMNQENIIAFAEELRSKVSKQEIKNVGYKTISIGATINNSSDTVDSIIQRADEALYESKDNGRDKVTYK